MNVEAVQPGIREKFGVSGSTIKLIAIVTMLIDHIGAVILAPLVRPEAGGGNLSLIMTYDIMRGIGRIAFPIFCFLLVEGFFHTRSRAKYALRLAVFALISEIPFDLAFYKELFFMGHQNVFFTLLLGLLMMMGIEAVNERILPKIGQGKAVVGLIIQMVFFLAAAALATALHTDYSALGIIAIFGMYILRFNRLYMCIFEALFFLSFEAIWVIFSFLPIYFYNGKRGLSLKYLFYAFYPLHLLILYGIYQLFF